VSKSVSWQLVLPPPQTQHILAAVKSASSMFTPHIWDVYLLQGRPVTSVASYEVL